MGAAMAINRAKGMLDKSRILLMRWKLEPEQRTR